MTVKELIEKLSKMPQDFPVQIGTIDMECGEAKWVVEYDYYVEIESDKILGLQ